MICKECKKEIVEQECICEECFVGSVTDSYKTGIKDTIQLTIKHLLELITKNVIVERKTK